MLTLGSGENNQLWDMGNFSVIHLAYGKFGGYQRNKIEQVFYVKAAK